MNDEPEFLFRDIRIHKYVQMSNQIYEEALTPPVCDFCLDARVRWDYKTEPFVLDRQGFDGDWAACDACSEAIERDDLGVLLDRAVRGSAAYHGLGDPRAGGEWVFELVGRTGQVARAFFAHKRGGRRAFG